MAYLSIDDYYLLCINFQQKNKRKMKEYLIAVYHYCYHSLKLSYY